MKNAKSLYHGHRFPAAVISHAVRCLPVSVEPARHWRAVVRARSQCQLRNDSAMVRQVRRGLRPSRQGRALPAGKIRPLSEKVRISTLLRR